MTDPPTTIYHYTNASGLMGILNDNAIRATHIYYLNDHREYVGAFEIAKRIAPVIPPLMRHAPKLLEAIERQLDPYPDDNFASIFVTSFTEEWDDLSQWRGLPVPATATISVST